MVYRGRRSKWIGICEGEIGIKRTRYTVTENHWGLCERRTRGVFKRVQGTRERYVEERRPRTGGSGFRATRRVEKLISPNEVKRDGARSKVEVREEGGDDEGGGDSMAALPLK
ncbi:hypothetical protein PV327_000133 [Microctonus hyperodae]|uniref:Uncharacterized protein n=1 Tax=Microctonus hyperodae TaxID=165561 RepID=A0AA39G612_MICHY|nr:hypothetical protein PV327_000133 [Microctonus hyperodae]